MKKRRRDKKEITSQNIGICEIHYFNKGKYSPDTSGGKSLLAHELTHTVQQGASPVNNAVATKQFANQINTIHRAPQPTAASQNPASGIDISNKSGGSALPDDAKEYFCNHAYTGK